MAAPRPARSASASAAAGQSAPCCVARPLPPWWPAEIISRHRPVADVSGVAVVRPHDDGLVVPYGAGRGGGGAPLGGSRHPGGSMAARLGLRRTLVACNLCWVPLVGLIAALHYAGGAVLRRAARLGRTDGRAVARLRRLAARASVAARRGAGAGNPPGRSSRNSARPRPSPAWPCCQRRPLGRGSSRSEASALALGPEPSPNFRARVIKRPRIPLQRC